MLVPGTGNFHCGSCMRDHTLVKALRRAEVEAHMAGLYLPAVGDEPIEHDAPGVFFGGVNAYLQQRVPFFRRTPRWVDRLFDTAPVLNAAASMAGMTNAHRLGEMTLSMVRGEHGRQRKELARLVDWLRTREKPDVVLLNNALMIGMARQIKHETGAAVVCTLHGEDTFIDALPSGHRDQVWGELRVRAGKLDALIAVSKHHAAVMAERMGLANGAIDVVHNGIDLDDIAPAESPPATPTIGYLARLCESKGLHTLVDAFVELRRDKRYRAVRLHVAGAQTRSDNGFVQAQQAKLAQAGLADCVTWKANVSRARKVELLRSWTLMSVPATYGESFGLYVLEAWAAGLPVVEPDSGALGELLTAGGGGKLVAPDDPSALALGMKQLLDNPDEARALGAAGRRAVQRRFTADRMAEGVLRVLRRVLADGGCDHG